MRGNQRRFRHPLPDMLLCNPDKILEAEKVGQAAREMSGKHTIWAERISAPAFEIVDEARRAEVGFCKAIQQELMNRGAGGFFDVKEIDRSRLFLLNRAFRAGCCSRNGVPRQVRFEGLSQRPLVCVAC